MVALDASRSGQRRQEKLRRCRRIRSRRATARAWTNRASCPRADARSNPAARSGPGPGSAARPGSNTCCGSRRHHTRLRRGRRSNRRRRGDDRLWWLELWRNHFLHCIGGRLERHVLQTLLRARAAAASTSATGGAGSATPERGLALELIRGEWVQNQENDQGMRKKRGGDTLPPPLSLARNADRRAIASFSTRAGRRRFARLYCVVSFGETPMTFTPAPRATSIA